MSKDNITPDNARETWDIAWKIFFDSTKIWCPGFVRHLLGHKYADYFTESVSTMNESERVPTYGANKSTDAVISFLIDNAQKKILVEFQSYSDPTIGMRAFNYALTKGRLQEHTATSETWLLPETFIVNVRKHSSSVSGFRDVTFEFTHNLYDIKIPVVNAYESLPEIQTLMNEGDSPFGIEAMYSLYTKVTMGMEAPESPEEEFIRACALIAIPEAFNGTGVLKKEVDNMVFNYDASRPSLIEQIEARGIRKGEARGIEKGFTKGMEEGHAKGVEEGHAKGVEEGIKQGQELIIKQLMDLHHWSREQAVALITKGVLPDKKKADGSSGLKPMKFK